MIVDKILENCRIVTTTKILDANIAIDQGKIVQVARSAHMPDTDERIDVDGRIVIPGVIDPHVHFRDPGKTWKEDFKTGSISAAFGGVTTVFDMPNTKPFTDSETALEQKREIASKKSCVDYGFHFGISKKNLDLLSNVEVVGYKAFLSNKNVLEYADLQTALKNLDEQVVCVHAEDPDIITENKRKFKEDKPETMTKIWSVEAEVKAIEKVLELDFGTNRVHFCHVTTRSGLQKIIESPKKISCEVTPPHLFLDTSDYKTLKNFIKVQPSIKSAEEREGLWAMLGKIDCIGTDHAPHTIEEKLKGVFDAPSGMPGVETNLPLLINSVNKGDLSWSGLVRLTSHGVMEVFNLKGKGEIVVGKDADLVVIDNALEWIIEAENLHSKCAWTPYEGWKVKGGIKKVFLRGELLVDSGEFLGKPGFGKEVL